MSATHIIRFEDTDGEIRFGTVASPAGPFTGAIDVVEGDLYNGGLKPTGATATLKKLLAPIQPTNIFCIGLNYMKHYEESAKKRGVPLPSKPVIFMKPTSAVNTHNGVIELPSLEHGEELDYEVELAVVIGKSCKDVAVENALDYVAGYTVSNDVSGRYWQKGAGGNQWIKGKSFDGFCPFGPVLVTPEVVSDPQKLQCISRVNGEVRQNSNTADMIFKVAECIAWLSVDMTLEPGTLILTGTPEGVGAGMEPPKWMVAGDVVECEIESIGILSNTVVAKGGDAK